MIDERTEELAALFAFGLLEPEDSRAFETKIATDAELRTLVDELLQSAAALSHDAPAREPSPELRGKILSTVCGGEKIVRFPRPFAFVPWAIAAGLAIFCGLLLNDRTQLRGQLASLESKNDVCELKIASLDSMTGGSQQGLAVVAWDAAKQHGVLKIENMPQPVANRDYQLWILDPKNAQPVSAGVVSVDEKGVASMMFKPSHPVDSADKFAVSLERKGGAPQHEGPILMMSK
jgi:anti-sigma-K factor RskA